MTAMSIVTLLTVTFAASVLAQGTAQAEAKTAQEKAQIVHLEHLWLRAEQTGDAATLRKVLADDMLRPYPAGGVFIGKKAMLEYARSRKASQRPGHAAEQANGASAQPLPKFDQLRVWIYGDAALARGILTTRNSKGAVLRKTLFTDVFVRRQGRWQAVSAQENNVPLR